MILRSRLCQRNIPKRADRQKWDHFFALVPSNTFFFMSRVLGSNFLSLMDSNSMLMVVSSSVAIPYVIGDDTAIVAHSPRDIFRTPLFQKASMSPLPTINSIGSPSSVRDDSSTSEPFAR